MLKSFSLAMTRSTLLHGDTADISTGDIPATPSRLINRVRTNISFWILCGKQLSRAKSAHLPQHVRVNSLQFSILFPSFSPFSLSISARMFSLRLRVNVTEV